MVGAYSVGDWIGGRFQVFDVHEGGMSLVYVVNDQMGGSRPASRCTQDITQRTVAAVGSGSAGSPPNAGSGCSLVNTRILSGHTRLRSSMAGRTPYSS